MARPRKEDSWLPADTLRIRIWYRALLHTALSPSDPAKKEFRSADLQRFLELQHIDVRSSRLTDWKLGRCWPSKGRLLALRQISPEIAQCESVLNNRPIVSENLLSNFLITLDTVASPKNMRLQCLELISKLAGPWHPQVDESNGAMFGWRLPKLMNCVVAPEVARRLNSLDPLSSFDFCLHVAADYISPVLWRNEAATEEQPEKWQSLAMAWGFDILCMSLLINRLINRELSYAEGELASDSADSATLMRRV